MCIASIFAAEFPGTGESLSLRGRQGSGEVTVFIDPAFPYWPVCLSTNKIQWHFFNCGTKNKFFSKTRLVMNYFYICMLSYFFHQTPLKKWYSYFALIIIKKRNSPNLTFLYKSQICKNKMEQNLSCILWFNLLATNGFSCTYSKHLLLSTMAKYSLSTGCHGYIPIPLVFWLLCLVAVVSFPSFASHVILPVES